LVLDDDVELFDEKTSLHMKEAGLAFKMAARILSSLR